MKNSKRRLEFFSFYDRTGIQKHLEKMAAKGWLLEKLGGTWKYKAIEPANIHFAVTYFPDVSEFDPEPPEKMRAFQEFCSQGGWEFLTRTPPRCRSSAIGRNPLSPLRRTPPWNWNPFTAPSSEASSPATLSF